MLLLLIQAKNDVSEFLHALATQKMIGQIIEASTLQTGIEIFEAQGDKIDLIICDYKIGSAAQLRSLLNASSKTPCALLIDSDSILPELYLDSREAILMTIPSGDTTGLEKLLIELKSDGLFSENRKLDSDFLKVPTKNLVLNKHLQADIYLRLAPGKFCKRFKKGDNFDASDLETHFRAKGIEAFYLHVSQASVLFEDTAEMSDPEVAHQAAIDRLEIIHDVVSRMGFTPLVQELTKKTVSLTLRALGASPKLAAILKRIQINDGKYIASHSIMLAETACAIASRIGWNTSSVFFRLSLAAFIHDLPLKKNRLARIKTLAELKADPRLSADEANIQAFKSHPFKAAEYAREFAGIPPDVDTILVQHHELPDGTGFPRGLHSKNMSPLACTFIVAHDLLHYFLECAPSNDRSMDMIQNFIQENCKKYGDGAYLKILTALESGIPITLSEGLS